MDLKKIPLAVFAALMIIGLCVAVTTYVLYYSQPIHIEPEPEITVEIKMFSDETLLNEVPTNATLPLIDAEEENVLSYWIQNTGNVPATLSLTFHDLPQNWTYTWNYDGTPLNTADVFAMNITVSIPPEYFEVAADYTLLFSVTAEHFLP